MLARVMEPAIPQVEAGPIPVAPEEAKARQLRQAVLAAMDRAVRSVRQQQIWQAEWNPHVFGY